MKWLKGYDAQSVHVQSGTGRLSCSRTALKRCTSTETRWYKWLVSLVSPEIEEILLPRSFRSRMADALKTPRISTAIGSNMWLPTMPTYVILCIYEWPPILLPPLPHGRLQWHVTHPEGGILWRPGNIIIIIIIIKFNWTNHQTRRGRRAIISRESKKHDTTLAHNFAICWPNFKILSPPDSTVNV